MRNGYRGDDITPVLILVILNFLVFIGIRVADLMGHNLVFLLGFQPAGFIVRPWTIVTNLFTHYGIWHILANMITLYFFGRFLCGLVGNLLFFIIYFAGGLLGNVLFMVLGDPYSIAIGASGAVFSLGGALAVLTPRLRVIVFPVPVPMPLWVAVIGGFFLMSFVPGIAWQGHLGGLIAGLLAGLILRRRIRTPFS
ncbi:MAG: rhomboid family intramembrane serine protease [Chloroflexi bacterium]|nr:rhomboid family intramembrane serine protease [Chloroflexota bacterium]MBM3166962.1 rhomboid family intramembrane serine protease [Chloroflexota bacterium]MBM3173880.1 rhomboid family intramembrane serine protease [Chloroflexota bacterium]MBM4450592.1 rhomboid family intramembrane serine protease [Chloroflexota bacterium]MBM4453544.1 rhomboid family intramembrane serine protease [Chloroflexota bacterium]